MDKSIDKKLSTVKYEPSDSTHLSVDSEKCDLCEFKRCLFVCPANVYKEVEGRIEIEYENCLECGACRLACPVGSVGWVYPKAGRGVCLKFG